MIGHPGGYYGFTSNLLFLPDVDVEVYIDTTPGEDGFLTLLTAMFIMDVMLGEEPWLNLTTSCTFPAPWYQLNEEYNYNINTSPRLDVTMKPKSINTSTGPEVAMKQKSNKSNQLQSNIEQYIGEFGNFAYGNLSVYESVYESGVWNILV